MRLITLMMLVFTVSCTTKQTANKTREIYFDADSRGEAIGMMYQVINSNTFFRDLCTKKFPKLTEEYNQALNLWNFKNGKIIKIVLSETENDPSSREVLDSLNKNSNKFFTTQLKSANTTKLLNYCKNKIKALNDQEGRVETPKMYEFLEG